MSDVVPFALVPLIDESVTNFERTMRKALGYFATDQLVAEQSATYRAEVARVAKAAYTVGAFDSLKAWRKQLERSHEQGDATE